MASVQQIVSEQKQYEDNLREVLTIDESEPLAAQKVELNTTLVMAGKTVHLHRNAHYFPDQPLLEPFIDALNAKVRVDKVDYETQKATVRFLDKPSDTITLDCDELRTQEYMCDIQSASPRDETAAQKAAVDAARITDHFAPLMGDFARVLGEAVSKH
jgi:hypothetical protein